jgi:hypothetical protein
MFSENLINEPRIPLRPKGPARMNSQPRLSMRKTLALPPFRRINLSHGTVFA